jgi:hypothetical protein
LYEQIEVWTAAYSLTMLTACVVERQQNWPTFRVVLLACRRLSFAFRGRILSN